MVRCYDLAIIHTIFFIPRLSDSNSGVGQTKEFVLGICHPLPSRPLSEMFEHHFSHSLSVCDRQVGLNPAGVNKFSQYDLIIFAMIF